MDTKAVALWEEIEKLVQSQRLNKERVAAGVHGCITAKGELRRAANDIRLLSEHFRAITRKDISPDELGRVSAKHEAKWAKRKGKFKK